MKHRERIRSFLAGETQCILCNVPLPAHDNWPGKRVHTCQGLACVSDLDALADRLKSLAPGSVLVHPNSELCCGPKCGRFVDCGIYNSRSREFCCCSECWYRKDANPTATYVCVCGCGMTFRGNRSTSRRKGTAFFDFDHRAKYLLEMHITQCGDFGDIVRDYLGTFAAFHYRRPKSVEGSIFPFIKWCAENGLKNISDINPTTISKYLASCKQTGRKTPHYRISALATFFFWAIAEERYPHGNPVVNRIHAPRRSSTAPRPLSDGELALMWQLLGRKNDPRLLFAASIAEEAGLRIGEICNLRLDDVDASAQRVFVRLPNKSNKERYSLFGARTAEYFRRVHSARPENASHDHLLWDCLCGPMRIASLRRALRLALCKTYLNRAVNEVGFDRWSTHRLRHNMATSMRRGGATVATLMSVGGWQSMDAAGSYIEVTNDEHQREYEAAMERARKARSSEQRGDSAILTPMQLLERVTRTDEKEHCA